MLVAPAAGHAASCTSAATYSLDSALSAQCFTGNDTNQIDSSFTMFGKTGWILSDKNDGPDGTGVIEFLTAPANTTRSGDWVLDTFAGLTDVVITLKAGNGFGAFLLDTLAGLGGTWSSSKGLSHASIYHRSTPTTPPDTTPIPLPAAGWMLLAGLGALGALKMRRRAQG